MVYRQEDLTTQFYVYVNELQNQKSLTILTFKFSVYLIGCQLSSESIVGWISDRTNMKECRFQPFHGIRFCLDGIQDNFGIQVLGEMPVQM